MRKPYIFPATVTVALSLVALATLAPQTAHASSGTYQSEYVEHASRGPAFGTGFYLGRGRADVDGAESFSRDWLSVHLGLPVAAPTPDTLFSFTYNFQVATDVAGGTGVRPWLFSAEYEQFFPFDPYGYSEFSLFGSLGIGWQHFAFDDNGVRNFIFSTLHFGGRFYIAAGMFAQIGFSYQRAVGLSEEALDFDYWNLTFKFGFRLP